jgi:hypothetical protein
LYQQCKLRHAELAVYDKLYKESSNVWKIWCISI